MNVARVLRARRAAALPFTVIALAASAEHCKRQPPAGQPPQSQPARDAGPSASAWSVATRELGAHGELTKDAALRMFSLQIARLPGVDVPPADRSVPPCSTAAVLGVTQHWSELTEEQRAAIQRALAPVTVTRGQFMFTGVVISDARKQRIEALVRAALAQGERELGVFAPAISEIEAHVGSIRAEGETVAVGQALPMLLDRDNALSDDAGNNAVRRGRPYELLTDPNAIIAPTICHLRLSTNLPEPELEHTIRHEIFHCFQFAVLGAVPRSRLGNQPLWLTEGSAEWWAQRGAGLAPRSDRDRTLLDAYFERERFDMFDASYDAYPFFVHLESRATPLRTILDATTLGSVPALRRLLSNDNTANTWASRTAGLPFSTDWRLADTRLSSMRRTPRDERLAAAPVELASTMGSIRYTEVDVSSSTAWAVHAVGVGRAIVERTDYPWNRATRIGFCRAEGCNCPIGKRLAPGIVQSAATRASLAYTTLSEQPEVLRVSSLSEQDRCVDENAMDPCLLGAAWNLDVAHFEGQMRATLGAGLHPIRGRETLSFNGNEGTVEVLALTVEFDAAAGILTRVVGTGPLTARVTAQGGTLTSAEVRNRASFNTTVRLGTRWTAAPIPPTFTLAPFMQASTLRYTCAAGVLELTTPSGIVLRYTR